jgi:hypothetical protein
MNFHVEKYQFLFMFGLWAGFFTESRLLQALIIIEVSYPFYRHNDSFISHIPGN